MNIDEFIKKATELGYTEEMIQEEIKLYEGAQKEGVKYTLGLLLDELPKE